MPKNKTLQLTLFLPLLIAIFASLFFLRACINSYLDTNKSKAKKDSSPYAGEKIRYDVKMGMLSLGRAESINLPGEKLDGKQVNVMTMDTKLTNFTDNEKIYSDPQTLLPIRVERDILNFMNRERIIEDYDQENFTVTIIKHKGAKEQKFVIKKDSTIHNAVLLPYYVRRIPKLDVGRVIVANLPTRRIEVRLDSIEDITVPAGTFKAYHFTSSPRQIEIWISADERRIPLKIQGGGPFRYYLVMNSYTPPS
ncbi:MAG: DUF3108 domain-containing protein [Candidatus Omnitrophota bacterium]|jgi:hypothetical protein